MAELSWTWSDRLNATLGSCLSCFHASDPNATTIRPRTNELEGLLVDVADIDDAMSLHSNLGSDRSRRRRKRKTKTITVFGYTLFGQQPIQLPDDSDDELWTSRRRATGAISTVPSSSTLDSDAAALDAETITSGEIQQRLALAAEEQRLKEERRARRRDRKERKRISRALTAQNDDFEGFQGSGPSFSHSNPQSPVTDEFGPYVTVERPELDDDEADLDGAMYTHKAAQSTTSDGSDSRSRTSAPTTSRGPRLTISPRLDPALRKKPKSVSVSRSSASASTTQSLPIASPVNTAFPPNVLVVSPAVLEGEIGMRLESGMGYASAGKENTVGPR